MHKLLHDQIKHFESQIAKPAANHRQSNDFSSPVISPAWEWYSASLSCTISFIQSASGKQVTHLLSELVFATKTVLEISMVLARTGSKLQVPSKDPMVNSMITCKCWNSSRSLFSWSELHSFWCPWASSINDLIIRILCLPMAFFFSAGSLLSPWLPTGERMVYSSAWTSPWCRSSWTFEDLTYASSNVKTNCFQSMASARAVMWRTDSKSSMAEVTTTPLALAFCKACWRKIWWKCSPCVATRLCTKGMHAQTLPFKDRSKLTTFTPSSPAPTEPTHVDTNSGASLPQGTAWTECIINVHYNIIQCMSAL